MKREITKPNLYLCAIVYHDPLAVADALKEIPKPTPSSNA
jgi:hypothetical protein